MAGTKAAKRPPAKKPKQKASQFAEPPGARKARQEITRNVARNLKAALAKLKPDRSINALAQDAKVPYMNAYRAFSGRTPQSIATVAMLAKRLGCSIDSLVFGNGKPTPTKKPAAK